MGDSQRLLHILEAIDEIHSYTLNTDLTTGCNQKSNNDEKDLDNNSGIIKRIGL